MDWAGARGLGWAAGAGGGGAAAPDGEGGPNDGGSGPAARRRGSRPAIGTDRPVFGKGNCAGPPNPPAPLPRRKGARGPGWVRGFGRRRPPCPPSGPALP